MNTLVNENYFGERLKTARLMAGFSMEDLARRMGGVITKQAIGKYEKGLMKPGSDVLIRLADALGVKPEFFFRHGVQDLFDIEFRKAAGLDKKTQDSLRYRTVEFLERYRELENILGQKAKFESSFNACRVRSLEDAENAAGNVRKKWNLGLSPIVNLLEILEEKGIKVMEVEEATDFDGLNARAGDLYVIVLNRAFSPDHVRLTAAHELAHILCDIHEKEHKEKLCFAFAGALLLPREVLMKELGQSRKHITLWELGELKRIYGISMQAILHRAEDLGIISKSCYVRSRRIFKEKGWLEREPVEYEREDRAVRFRQLLNYAVAEEIITFSKAAELANMSLVELRNEIQAVV